MSADTRGLTALVEITEGDVRSCLNTLQVRFLAIRQRSRIVLTRPLYTVHQVAHDRGHGKDGTEYGGGT